MGRQEGRFVPGLSSCTVLTVAENATALVLYPYFNLQLPLFLAALCTNCCLIPWHILPQVSPAVPLRGLLHPSQLLSSYLSILVSNLGYKAGPFSRQCLLKTQERAWLPRPSLLLPSHSWQAAEVRLLQDSPAAFGRVKSAAREPINPDRLAVASSGVKGVHYAHSQSR